METVWKKKFISGCPCFLAWVTSISNSNKIFREPSKYLDTEYG